MKIKTEKKMETIKKSYIKKYGCVSCWADLHRCSCRSDKVIIEAFYNHLIHKLKDQS